MRKIIFRGKDIKTGEWCYGYYCLQHLPDEADRGQITTGYQEVSVIFNDEPGHRHKGGYWHEVIPTTLGQFTGLTDKHGHEIYEGDVVRYSDESDDDYPRYGVVDSVVFEDGCFWPVSESWVRDKEVIGNIHDNPELLKR